MSVQILGPVRIQRGTELLVPSPRLARLLLGILALRANSWVSASWICDAMWGDRSPKSAGANLRGYVTRLRRQLAPARLTGVSIDTGPSGYLLHAETDALDCLLFDSLVSEGRRLLAAGQREQAADRLQRALSLWRGPVLDGIGVPDVLQPELQALMIKRQDAIEHSVLARPDDERGTAPFTEIQQLHQRILQADPTLRWRSDRPVEAPHRLVVS